MTVSRREWLQGVGAVAVGASLPVGAVSLPGPLSDFPRKDDFNITPGFTYLNGAYTHPMPRAAAEASQRVTTRRSTLSPPTGAQYSRPGGDPRSAFASLINAKPSELSLIPNTSTGENLVVEALGIPGGGDYNVVTDGLHFDGSLVHLFELKKRGLDLRVVTPREGRIEMADLERVVDNKTRLIEISLVAMYNGFQHDLKAVCDLAHAHGAYVYADIIQAAGAVPIDVRASGVDFAATASYKWLMGDFGIGFLYVREDLLDRVVRRTHWSYESAPDADIHQSPFDPQHGQVVTYTPGTTAAEYFQLGTMDYTALAALGVSIPYLLSLGVENIQRHRQPMIDKLQKEMPRLGYTPQTPVGSTSPIVTFAHKDADGITKRFTNARVEVRVAPYWMRIAPSVYNDLQDVDRLLEALS